MSIVLIEVSHESITYSIYFRFGYSTWISVDIKEVKIHDSSEYVHIMPIVDMVPDILWCCPALQNNNQLIIYISISLSVIVGCDPVDWSSKSEVTSSVL